MKGKVTFITGGARSGKSRFAVSLASELESVAFIATCEPLDEEMKKRVLRHKAERPDNWDTYEEPLYIPALIEKISGRYEAILIDCLTLWASNIMNAGLDPEELSQALRSAIASAESHVILVSNEVGMGIVPENALARAFRDITGRLNQSMAEVADEAFFMVSGMPLKIK